MSKLPPRSVLEAQLKNIKLQEDELEAIVKLLKLEPPMSEFNHEETEWLSSNRVYVYVPEIDAFVPTPTQCKSTLRPSPPLPTGGSLPANTCPTCDKATTGGLMSHQYADEKYGLENIKFIVSALNEVASTTVFNRNTAIAFMFLRIPHSLQMIDFGTTCLYLPLSYRALEIYRDMKALTVTEKNYPHQSK